MKREAKVLRQKALESLTLSIELFNRPWSMGRTEAVLILLDRAFELLLKAVIVHRGGKIRKPKSKETIGFDACVRKCVTDADVACLTEEQAITPQVINSLRDAAQHYLVDVSEDEFYTFTQAGVTLIAEILSSAFSEKLSDHLPDRVLPISTRPPRDLPVMIDQQFREIKELLSPGSRKRLEARAKLRPLAIIEASLRGTRTQPTERELAGLIRKIQGGVKWQDLFPGVASLQIDADGTTLSLSIRLTKREGEAVHLVPEGTPGATVVAVKRVNELDYYSLGLQQLAKKLKVTQPKTLALVKYLDLQSSEEFFKEIRVGKATFKRYSPKALDALKKALKTADMEAIWQRHRPRRHR